MENSEKLKLAQWIWEKAKKSGADQAAIYISHQVSTDIIVRAGKVENSQGSTSLNLSLSIYADRRFSSNTTSDLRPASLETFIKNSVELTKCLAADDFRSLADPKFYPKSWDLESLRIRDKDYEKLTVARRVEIAKEMESVARGLSDKLISASATVSDGFWRNCLFLSNGFSALTESTSFSYFVEATVKDGDRQRPEDYYYASARNFADLPAPALIAKEAVNRALAKIGQDKTASGKYDMLVQNNMGGRLLRLLTDAMRASAIQQNSSYLEGKTGSKIASDKLTLTDDPAIVSGMGSRAFDGEGIAASKRMMIENGVLRNFYIDNYYGSKLKLDPNGGSTSNIVVACGTKSFDELVKSISRGIIITGFIGGNANTTTGDFSLGITGRLIGSGNITKPVSSMNIAGNCLSFWNQLSETGNDPFIYSTCRCPSMLFKGVAFSGT